jgi:hypothetical protein
MAHHYIAFGNFKTDWPLVNQFYPQAAGSRVTLQQLKSADPNELPRTKLWLDAEIDCLHHAEIFNPADKGFDKYRTYVDQFPNARKMVDAPDGKSVGAFVNAVLDAIMMAAGALENLAYISVPQLPYIPGGSRNRINRLLAEHALKWKSSQRKPPRMILPVVFAKTWGQTDGKTNRKMKVNLAKTCFEASGADGIWVVDSTLNDHDSSGPLENQRLPGIIHFHEELNSQLPSEMVTIAGPYWALNLALWARGLVRFPAIGVGRGYQYSVPGRDPQSAADIRVAVPPLKRLASSTALRPWLHDALRRLRRDDPVYNEFVKLGKKLEALTKKSARRQVAEFYKEWLYRLESVPASSRALTLYQDLSAAFVLGSSLQTFDKGMEDVPNPAVIAKQLMVNCL